MAAELTPDALVIGSINVDIRLSVPHLPKPGETVLSTDTSRGLGGKGANQAVALRTLGVRTGLVAAVGDDEVASWLLDELAEAGIDTSAVHQARGASGQAQVVVDDRTGENLIVVSPGANGSLTPAHVERALFASTARVVLAQQEVPTDTVAVGLGRARREGRFTILNAAPARPVDPAVLACVDLLVVNEGEALSLAGCSDVWDAPARLRAMGAAAILISLGGEGLLIDAGDDSPASLIAAPPVEKVVDTTGAGDVLTGAVAAAVARDRSLREAAEIAVRAATWSVQHAGVRAPKLGDIDVLW